MFAAKRPDKKENLGEAKALTGEGGSSNRGRADVQAEARILRAESHVLQPRRRQARTKMPRPAQRDAEEVNCRPGYGAAGAQNLGHFEPGRRGGVRKSVKGACRAQRLQPPRHK